MSAESDLAGFLSKTWILFRSSRCGVNAHLACQMARGSIPHVDRLATGRSKLSQANTGDLNMLGRSEYLDAGIPVPENASSGNDMPWMVGAVPELVSARPATRAGTRPPVSEPLVREETTSGLRIRCDGHLGILEIMDPRMFRPGKEAFCEALCTSAIVLGNASSVDLDVRAHRCRFHFEPDKFGEAEIAHRVALAIKSATLAAKLETTACQKGRVDSARTKPARPNAQREEETDMTGSDRFWCMALGSGSLMAAVAGLILPGIPSSPFVFISAHYFLRSSTSFRRWLDGMPKLSELLRKLEAPDGMPVDRATFVKTLAMMILLGMIFLLVHPPLPLVLAIELGLTVYFGLREIGDLEALFEELTNVFA
jgi:uncharacterized membrane protein YbaN (DUF454 family)